MNRITQQLWKRDRHLCHIFDAHRNIRLLSVDVFDTILFRACKHPTDIFTEVGARAIERSLLRKGLTPKEFQQIRIESEKKARAQCKCHSGHIEVGLGDIYAQLPANVGDGDRLAELEMEVERDICYVNPSILSFIEEACNRKIPIVLLSDMYLSAEQMMSILSHNHFPVDAIDRIFVSSEYQCCKSDGLLFREVLRVYDGVRSSEILHIGDNKNSDVLAARREGIDAVHYDVVSTDFRSSFEWEHLCAGDLIPQLLSVRKLAASCSAEYPDEERFWYELGASILGPVFTLFSEWIIASCIEENKRAIYPLMREGKLFRLLLERTALHKNVDIKVRELYVSRQATYFAGLKSFTAKEVNQLFERRNIRIKDVFRMFEIHDGISVFEAFSERYLDEARNIDFDEHTTVQEQLTKFLLQDDILAGIETTIREQRKLLIEYISETTELDKPFVTVDFGFKGTIQNALETALKSSGLRIPCTHFLTIGSEYTSGMLANGMDIRGFLGNAGENKDLVKTFLRSPDCIESLITSEHGSTIGYRRDETIQATIPIMKENPASHREQRWKEVCWHGILQFQDLWFYLSDRKPEIMHPLVEQRRPLFEMLHRIIDMPEKQEADRLSELTREENFGSEYLGRICNDEHDRMLAKSTPERFLEQNLSNYNLGRISWPQGVVAGRHPEYFFAKAVYRNPDLSYLSTMNAMVQNAQNEGVRQCIVYGAGDVGQALLRVLDLHRIQASCVVDRREDLWGDDVNGVSICSLDQATERPIGTYFVASFAYADEIEKTIRSRYKSLNRSITIYKPAVRGE